jgi:hypothetical protein
MILSSVWYSGSYFEHCMLAIFGFGACNENEERKTALGSSA